MEFEQGQQIVKTRDDSVPVTFASITEPKDRFKLAEGVSCSWTKGGEEFVPEKLRERIEPWLTALCQSEHLSLLVGTGLTHAVHRLATDKSLPGMNCVHFKTLGGEITAEVKRTAKNWDGGKETLKIKSVW
jgi:hypothetical protein